MILPLIDEEAFREAFHDSNGRPNKSILLLMGAQILKHWNDLTDAQVIEQVEFNLQWQYALNLTADEAHLVQRTMHSFRQLLLENDRARRMFDDITHKPPPPMGSRWATSGLIRRTSSATSPC